MFELNLKITGYDEADLETAIKEACLQVLAGEREKSDESDSLTYSYAIKGNRSITPECFQARVSSDDLSEFVISLERISLKGDPELVYNIDSELFSFIDIEDSPGYIKIENSDYQDDVHEGDTILEILESVFSSSNLEKFVRENQKYADDFSSGIGWL